MNVGSEPITKASVGSFDFEGIFLAHYSRIVRVINSVVNDSGRSEDLAMEVFWKLWRKPPRKTSDAGGWLYRTAVRAGLDDLRRQARREKYERLFSFMRASARPEQSCSTDESRQRVRNVLASLNKRHAELLILRSDDMSYEEVAQALALNPA